MNPLRAVETVRTFSAVIERCPDTGLLVGHVPGFPGAHSQGLTLDELQANLQEVIAMLLQDGEPAPESDFVGLQQIPCGVSRAHCQVACEQPGFSPCQADQKIPRVFFLK
jgi:predicted RNase H-like HicB family nuclease